MLEHNRLVEKYIIDYLSLKNPPHYAVMLDGAWGTGKTFFIKKIINQINQNSTKKDKVLYISLYGINSLDEIWNEIFAQQHPVLSSKTALIANGILKKFTFNIDIFGDDKKDASLNTFIDNFFTKDNTNCSLVFDDLERASVPISNVLGYINKFVEHQGLRVIIVTNENEISRKSEEYLRTKEKLIGKTLKIIPEIESLFDSSLSQIEPTTEIEQLLTSSNIIKIFSARGNPNLRILKNTISNLNFLLKNHEFDIEKNILRFIDGYTILSILIFLDKIKIEDMLEIKWWDYSKDSTSTIIRNTYDQYYANITNNSLDILDFKDWHSVITNGYLNERLVKKINYSLDPLEILYSRNLHSEKQIKSALEETVKKFTAMEFEDLEKLLKSVSLILEMKNDGYATTCDKLDIEQITKQCIDNLINKPNTNFINFIAEFNQEKMNDREYNIPKENINFAISYLLSKMDFFAQKSADEFSKEIIESIKNNSRHDHIFYAHENKNKAIKEIEIPVFIYLKINLVKNLLSEDISQNSRENLLYCLENLSTEYYTNSDSDTNQQTVDSITTMISEIEQEKDKHHGLIRKFIDEFVTKMGEIKTLFESKISETKLT